MARSPYLMYCYKNQVEYVDRCFGPSISWMLRRVLDTVGSDDYQVEILVEPNMIIRSDDDMAIAMLTY